MIVILKKNPDQQQLDRLRSWLEERHIAIHPTVGVNQTIWGLVGDTSHLDINLIASLDIVDDVKRVQEPYKNAKPWKCSYAAWQIPLIPQNISYWMCASSSAKAPYKEFFLSHCVSSKNMLCYTQKYYR